MKYWSQNRQCRHDDRGRSDYSNPGVAYWSEVDDVDKETRKKVNSY
jgi:hypothetical protein